MAPKTSSIRDNPPSASSSSSSGESGSATEASGSSEYESTDDEATKPNGKPGASSTLTPSPKKRQSGGSSSKSDDESGDDSDETNGKPDDSSRKAPSSQVTKQSKTPASSTESDSESTDDEAAKPGSKQSSKRPPTPAPKKKPQPVEEDSGSDSETESSEGKRDQKPGSVSSKALSQQQKAPVVSGKREAEKSPDQKSSKRAKKDVDEKKLALIPSQDSEKKIPFQRTFTDSDEIEILKGTAEFEGKKKGSVVQDANGFYEFITTRVETKFTKQQLLKKLQSMKRRFPGLVNRVNKGSKTLKPLDHTLYELSNKLWGPGGCLEKTEKELTAENATPAKARNLPSSSSKLAKKKTVMVPAVEVSNNDNTTKKRVVSSWYMSENLGVCHKGGVDAEYMREVMESVDEEEKAELEGRWRKNQADMARVVEERSRIAQQLCKLVDKYSSSSS